MDPYHLIKDAILRKRQIVATYDGSRREMCPHVLGMTGGRAYALFYQFAGESRSGLGPPGSPQNWRCCEVDRLEDVSARDGRWHGTAFGRRRQQCIERIDIEAFLVSRPAER